MHSQNLQSLFVDSSGKSVRQAFWVGELVVWSIDWGLTLTWLQYQFLWQLTFVGITRWQEQLAGTAVHYCYYYTMAVAVCQARAISVSQTVLLPFRQSSYATLYTELFCYLWHKASMGSSTLSKPVYGCEVISHKAYQMSAMPKP